MNLKEQIAAKVETLNALLRFLEQLEKEQGNNPETIENVRKYVLSMKQGYKEAYGIISKQVSN